MSAIGPIGWEDTDRLRGEFMRLLTEDSGTRDARRKDFNQAVFMADGGPVWTETTLNMIMGKFDKAVRNLRQSAKASV